MKRIAFSLFALLCCSVPLPAQIANFSHIIVVVQENRNPDNLFQGLCVPPYGGSQSCSTNPTASQYDIQTKNWLNNASPTGITQPGTISLAGTYDMNHQHLAFTQMCDVNKSTGTCRMDGAAAVSCTGTCTTNPAFQYVANTNGILDPYLTMVTQYGWANYMFQTNQGPSYPAHQFLFGGTSAPSAADDAAATFTMNNMEHSTIAGCIAPSNAYVYLISPGSQSQTIYPCFEHETMSDLLTDAEVSWKYYTSSGGTTIWTAPNSINHICEPNKPTGGKCEGQDYLDYVVTNPAQVLTDIPACELSGVSWVIPTGQNSDHSGSNTGGGPSWVASIVNAIGNNPKCKDGETYWDNTAILILWDDWGGFYDHERPTFLKGSQGDYQYGFRVPLIVVSAYTRAGYIDNTRMDFGSILRFIEHNFGIAEGALNFADARSSTDLAEFFNLKQVPRVFETVPARLHADYFIHDKTPPTDPDDD